MIARKQETFAKTKLFKGKALIVLGPRQVGKTTFVENLVSDKLKTTQFLNGDDSETRALLANPSKTMLKKLVGKNTILVIDEAQRIPDIGIVIKIIVDQIKEVQVIATGSSAFELANKVNEPLTGRKYEMFLYPFSFSEMANQYGHFEEKSNLEQRLIFGCYPEIVVNPVDAEEHIKLIANSYLYKDLFILDQVTKPALLEKIVKVLVLQIGSEVNYQELSLLVKADNKTIEKYIDLLEKAFVIFKLDAYSGNVRNEITKKKKIYFYDNGIVNAVTGNFLPLSKRADAGALWENFIISERKKWLNINRSDHKFYFWRSAQQQEVDYIETTKKELLACEIKWNPKVKAKIPLTFTNAYNPTETRLISRANYDDFLIE